MKSNEIMKTIFSRLNARRLVSKLGVTEPNLIKYGRTIDYINTKRKSTIIDDQMVSDYKIWKPFRELILPIKVTLTGEARGKDLSLQDNTVYNDVFTVDEFTDISYTLNGAFKGDNSQIVSVTRNVISINEEVLKRMSYNNYVRADAQGTPIPFSDNLLYESDNMFCVSEEDYWKENVDLLLDKFSRQQFTEGVI